MNDYREVLMTTKNDSTMLFLSIDNRRDRAIFAKNNTNIGFTEIVYYRKEEDDVDLFFQDRYQVMITPNSAFLKKVSSNYIAIDRKKKKVRAQRLSKCIIGNNNMITIILKKMNVQWHMYGIRNMLEDNHVIQYIKGALLEKILLGKITNFRQVVRHICVYTLKTREFELMHKFFIADKNEYKIKSCTSFVHFMPYIEKKHHGAFIDMILKAEFYQEHDIFRDYLEQIKLLGLKFNPRHSIKRVMSEHDKLSKMLLIEAEKYLENIEYYEKDLTLKIPISQNTFITFRLIRTSKELFREGTQKSHCVYTNYGDRVESHDYIVFSNYEFTMGIRKLKNTDGVYPVGDRSVIPHQIFEIDQIRGIGNRTTPSPENYDCIRKFIHENQEMLSNALLNKFEYRNSEVETKPMIVAALQVPDPEMN